MIDLLCFGGSGRPMARRFKAKGVKVVAKMSDDSHLLSWPCPKCQHRSWLHYDHCMQCGEPRPQPVEKPDPSHEPLVEPDPA